MTLPAGRGSGESLRDRIHAAWELSRPQAYGAVLQEEEQELRHGRLERIEEAVASVFYFLTFASVVVSVFFRFVLDQPLVWSLEVPTYTFFWCFCIASGLSDWRDEQISFDLVSQHLRPRLRLVGRAAANVIIVATFILVIPGTVSFIQYEIPQPATGLPFGEVWGYAGIVPFVIITILLRGRLLLLELRELGVPIPWPPRREDAA